MSIKEKTDIMEADSVIVFEDYKIYKVNTGEDSESESNEDAFQEEFNRIMEPDEDLLPRSPDIYSDDHPLDTTTFHYRFKPEVWLYDYNE